MEGDKYETEAKIHAIIAMGDVSLASNQNFVQYLSSTMNSFMNASHKSVNKGADEDQEAMIMKLRSSLIESYIAILHGMNPDKEEQEKKKIPVLISPAVVDQHAM
jgi:hypothetical protein